MRTDGWRIGAAAGCIGADGLSFENRGPAMTGPAAARLHPAHAFAFVALIAPHGAAAFQQRAARPVVGARERVSLVHTAVILTEPALDSFKSHTVRRGRESPSS